MLEKVKWSCSQKLLDKFYRIYLWISRWIYIHFWYLFGIISIMNAIGNNPKDIQLWGNDKYDKFPTLWDQTRWQSYHQRMRFIGTFPQIQIFLSKNRDSRMFCPDPVRSWSPECCWQRDKINQIRASIVYTLYIVAITNCKSLFTNLKTHFSRIQEIRLFPCKGLKNNLNFF